jgi:hypothetical protein
LSRDEINILQGDTFIVSTREHPVGRLAAARSTAKGITAGV